MSQAGASGADGVLAQLRARGWTIGTAESLTGGLLCAALTDVPGSSAVVRGAVVSYATDVKASVLGVDAALLARSGAVHPEVAAQMASGVCRVLACDVGVATTGVAGPAPSDGQPVGRVFVAVQALGATRPEVRELALAGGRSQIRNASVVAALDLLDAVLRRLPARTGSQTDTDRGAG
jgi:nicotinamide-nucleotide amidase